MTRVIAHRGASSARPENTVEAFAHAVVLGADGVELDVRRSSDRRLVVSHDPVYADGRTVSEVSFDDRPAGICGLADAVAASGELLVNVEIKNDPNEPGHDPTHGIADQVVAELDRLGDAGQFLVSSFVLATIDRVRTLAGAPPTALLTYRSRLDHVVALDLAAEHGHAAVHPHDDQVDVDYVSAARRRGLEINVWTVDDPRRVAELAELGVDGVVTNVPDVARRAMA